MSASRSLSFRSPSSHSTHSHSPAPLSPPPSSPLVCRYLLSRVSISPSSSLFTGEGSDVSKRECYFSFHPSDIVQQHFITGQWVIAHCDEQESFPPLLGQVWPSQAVKCGEIRLFTLSEQPIAYKEGQLLTFSKLPEPLPSILSIDFIRSPSFSSSSSLSSSVNSFFVHSLADRFITEKQKFRYKLFGSIFEWEVNQIELQHNNTVEGLKKGWKIGKLTSNTLICFNQEKTKEIQENKEKNSFTSVDFSGIGGLNKQLELIREVVEFPFHHPDFFERYEIRPPRGILLYGAPGTGNNIGENKHKRAASNFDCFDLFLYYR
jgi:hypothetical protein